MEQKRVDYSCFISWYNNRGKKLVSEKEKEGTISESWLSLASHPSAKQQLQGSGIIDFKGINSQLQIVPFQGIICKLSCSHKPAGAEDLIQNCLKWFGHQFQEHLWVNKSPGWKESQFSEHLAPGRSPFTDNFLKTEEKWFPKWGTRFFFSVEVSCEDCTWHTSIPAQPLVPFEPAEKVQTGKHSLCWHHALPSNAHRVN